MISYKIGEVYQRSNNVTDIIVLVSEDKWSFTVINKTELGTRFYNWNAKGLEDLGYTVNITSSLIKELL
jgi:hypothetical protein